ncbi:DUF4097 family beta strand repeat-containing protein [Fodinicola feengrottensis]|nr:DUF4097 family beta strand repeat-containing protein [Fodinicola feengrottensis]
MLELVSGTVRIRASDRTDTSVQILPSNGAESDDVRLAEATTVDYSAGKLRIGSPKRWKASSFLGEGGSLDVVIDLPTGSRVAATAWAATFRATGTLSDCVLKTSDGDIWLDTGASLDLRTDSGDIAVDRATGHAKITTETGAVRVRELESTAAVKDGEGNIWIGTSTGDLTVYAGNGDIAIDRALTTVTAKTEDGDVHVGEVSDGEVSLETANGDLEVGIAKGVAVWLDAKTVYGDVRNALTADDMPDQSKPTVTVRARTANGDITINRSHLAPRD